MLLRHLEGEETPLGYTVKETDNGLEISYGYVENADEIETHEDLDGKDVSLMVYRGTVEEIQDEAGERDIQ